MPVMPALNTIIIYAKNMQRTAEYYQKFFGFASTGKVVEGLIELTSPTGGTNILIHQAAKSVKLGQVGVKLMFDVKDIEGFKKKCAALVWCLAAHMLRTAIHLQTPKTRTRIRLLFQAAPIVSASSTTLTHQS
jgi:hypothetical protein